jgi:hypothetical protein
MSGCYSASVSVDVPEFREDNAVGQCWDDRRRVASVKSGGSGREGIYKTIIEARRQTATSISSQAYKEESLEVVARCGRGKKKMIVDGDC